MYIVRYAQLIDCNYNNNLLIIVLWGLRGSLEPVPVVTSEHSYCRWMYIDFFKGALDLTDGVTKADQIPTG